MTNTIQRVCVSGEDLLQIRGQNGLLLNSTDPLPEMSGKQEVADTADHVLDAFYPVSPTIDLQKVHVYKEEVNHTGERLASCRPFCNAGQGPGVLCLLLTLSDRSLSRPLRFQR